MNGRGHDLPPDPFEDGLPDDLRAELGDLDAQLAALTGHSPSGRPSAGEPAPGEPQAGQAPARPAEPTPRQVVLLPKVGIRPLAQHIGRVGLTGHLVPLGNVLALVLSSPADDDQLLGLSTPFVMAECVVVDLIGGVLSVRTLKRRQLSDPGPAGMAAQFWPDQIIGLVHGSTDPATLPGATSTGDAAQESGRGGLFGRLFGRGARPEPPAADDEEPRS